MPIESETLQKILEGAFPGGHVHIEDLAGDNDHYRATIIAKQFANKSRIQQHTMVYESLKNTEAHDLHALSLKTQAPNA